MAASKKTQRPQGPLVDAQRALAKKEAMARQVRIEELRLARERARGKRAEDERALRELTIDERRRDRELRSRRDRLERERREEEERRHQEEAEALKKRIEDLEKKLEEAQWQKALHRNQTPWETAACRRCPSACRSTTPRPPLPSSTTKPRNRFYQTEKSLRSSRRPSFEGHELA